MTLKYDFDGDDYEFELDCEDSRGAIVDLLKKCDKEQLIEIITGNDNTYDESYLNLLTDEELQQIIINEIDLDVLENILYEDLYDYFNAEASQQYADDCAFKKEQSSGYDWYK